MLLFVALPAAIGGYFLPIHTGSMFNINANATYGARGIGGVIAFFLSPFSSAGLAYISVNALNHRVTSLQEAVSKGASLYLPMLGMTLLIGICVIFGFVLLIVPGVFLLIAWSVAAPVRTLEPITALAAMGRSFDLTRGYRLPILGVLVILLGIAIACSIPVAILAAILGRWVSNVFLNPMLTAFMTAFAGAIVAAVYQELLRLKEGGGISAADIFE